MVNVKLHKSSKNVGVGPQRVKNLYLGGNFKTRGGRWGKSWCGTPSDLKKVSTRIRGILSKGSKKSGNIGRKAYKLRKGYWDTNIRMVRSPGSV